MMKQLSKVWVALGVALMFVLHVNAADVCPDTLSQGGRNTTSASFMLHDSIGGIGGVSQTSASFQSVAGYMPQVLNGCSCMSCDDFVAEACVQLQLSRQTSVANAVAILEGWLAGSDLYSVDICADAADGAGAAESCAAFILQSFQPNGGGTTQAQAEVRVRKEIHTLTAEERALFTTTYRQAWDAPNSELKQMADDFLTNFSRGLHNNGAFLPWHRGYLLQVENLLRKFNPNVTIPYWDWSLYPQINQDPIWGSGPGQFSGDGGTDRCVVDDGPFGSGSGFALTNGSCLQRRLGGGSAATVAEVDDLFARYPSAGQYDNFRNRLEHGPGLHDSVHCLVGGTMCSSRASNDPIFFTHHANIDRIWGRWQDLSEAHRVAYTGVTSLDELMPASPYTARDVLDMRHLPTGIRGRYAETIYEQNVAEGSWITRHGLTSEDYQAQFDEWSNLGYRLTYVSGHESNGEARYNCVWYKMSSVAWRARHGQTASEYQATVDAMKVDGFQPVLVDGFNVGNNVLFVSIFEKNSSSWEARHGMTAGEYQDEVDDLVDGQGYRIRHVSGYAVGDQAYYAAIFDKSDGPAWVARHGMTATDYQNEFDTWHSQGYQPVVIDGFFVGANQYFAAVWHKDNTRFVSRHNVAGGSYQQVADDFIKEGYKPFVIDGSASGSNIKYATMWQNTSWDITTLDQLNTSIETFRTSNNIPAISVAITKDERLVYAKAFGVADTGSNEAAHTGHRFRIASLSKSLTGAAVTQLIEDNQLALDDTVFGTGGVLGLSYGTPTSDVATIEVQDLLEHTGGGWCGGPPYIMFTNNAETRDWLISDTLANNSLAASPNTTFCYSNFGYSVLEAVIEATNGGTPYVDHIKQVLADSTGATSLEVAGNTLASRLSNEVIYYDYYDPYYWNVTRMAGHGGWVVTPIDYLRIMTRLDGQPNRPDLLGSTGIDIYSRDDRVVSNDAWGIANGYYAKGLVIDLTAQKWSHNGNFNGTIAEYMRYDDGFSIMLVINTRNPPSSTATSPPPKPALGSLGLNIYTSNYSYPSHDLF